MNKMPPYIRKRSITSISFIISGSATQDVSLAFEIRKDRPYNGFMLSFRKAKKKLFSKIYYGPVVRRFFANINKS